MKPGLVLKGLEAQGVRALTLPEAPTAPVGETSRASAYDEGLREGLAQARREAEALREAASRQAEARIAALEAEKAAALRELGAVVTSLSGAQAAFQREREEVIVALAYEALLRVLGRLDGARPLVVGMVRAMLDSRGEGERLTVLVSAADYARLAQLASQDDLGESLQAVEWVADERLVAGECRVVGAAGETDLGLPQQLAALTRAWLAALGQDADGGPAKGIPLEGGAR